MKKNKNVILGAAGLIGVSAALFAGYDEIKQNSVLQLYRQDGSSSYELVVGYDKATNRYESWAYYGAGTTPQFLSSFNTTSDYQQYCIDLIDNQGWETYQGAGSGGGLPPGFWGG